MLFSKGKLDIMWDLRKWSSTSILKVKPNNLNSATYTPTFYAAGKQSEVMQLIKAPSEQEDVLWVRSTVQRPVDQHFSTKTP